MPEYMPTTEEIRDYVEVGGEPRPWMPPEPEKDGARAAAFDRWLDDHDASVRAEAREQALREALQHIDDYLGVCALLRMEPSTQGVRDLRPAVALLAETEKERR